MIKGKHFHTMQTRKVAYNILNHFDSFKEKIPVLLDRSFNKYSGISNKDRNRIIASVNEVVRFRGLLDHIIEKGSKRKIQHVNPKLRNVLRLGLYELLFDELVPDFAAIHSSVELAKRNINRRSSSMVNAVMRNIQRFNDINDDWKKTLIKDKVYLAYPDWLVKRWELQFGSTETLKLCNTLLMKNDMYIRLNVEKLNIEEMHSILLKDEIDVSEYKDLKYFFKVNIGREKILDNSLFKSGIISIQDPASGAVVNLLDPQKDEFILDACAAPGTKSLLMAQKVGVNGKIYAYDINDRRVSQGKKDILRHNYKNIDWYVADASKDEYPTYNKILIDAPCSGTGVIGRRPDIKWRLKEGDIKKMSVLQKSILANMSKYLEPGGKIVYSTCSLEKEENEDVVNDFLAKRKDFKLVVSNSLLPDNWITSNGFMFAFPNNTKTDGLFAAVLQKVN
mgnify:CR=1 FL=1